MHHMDDAVMQRHRHYYFSMTEHVNALKSDELHLLGLICMALGYILQSSEFIY